MPGMTADEAWQKFNDNGGEYGGGWNNPNAFANEAEWSAFKDRVPKAAKQAFRAKVAGNEARAIEGMSQGLSREQMGIFNEKENGQALYRRLGAGLGTGLDMGRAYDWGGGTALNVGTSDLAKRGIERRAISPEERQRYADFQAAGSPEAYFRNYRGQQINGLLNSGAIERDGQGGYRNPGGGDSYGSSLQGYNLGQNVMGQGRGRDWREGGGYDPGQVGVGAGPARQQSGGQPPQGQPFDLANYPGMGGGSPMNGGGGGQGGAYQMPNMRSFGQQGGQQPQTMSFGATPNAAPQMSYGAPQAPVAMPQGSPQASPPFQAPQTPNGGTAAPKSQGEEGLIYERRPGTVGPFGAPGTGNPSGNSLFPALTPPGSGGTLDPSAPGGGAGGGFVPGWRPEGNLDGVPMTQSGLPPGQGDFTNFMNTSFAQNLGQMGQGDARIQDFNLMRALQEYAKSQGLEGTVLGGWGDALGIDPTTGQPLQGRAADTANARSFGQIAPQVQRLQGDQDAVLARLKREMPEGGEKSAAIADLLRGGASNIAGLRQQQAADAMGGIQNLMMAEKSFDPGAYTGGDQALLGAYGQGRGQDIGAYGNALQALLGQRGQDVQWGLGQGNLGLGWAGLDQQGQQNAWNNYLQGRGQDMNLYSNTRGQDISQQQAAAAQRAQQQQANRGFWGNILGTVGGLAGTLFGGPVGGAIGGGLGRAVGGGGGASGGW